MISHICSYEIDGRHLINGQRESSPTAIEVVSPINQSRLGEVAAATPGQVALAVGAAADAFPTWSSLNAEKRRDVLHAFAAEIGKRKEQFCDTESTDAGVLRSRMAHGVVARVQLNLTFFADAALTLQNRTLETAQATHHIAHDPAGVCAIITPWNAPLMLTTWKLGPALAAGNTVVIKPPEWAPLTCALLAECAVAANVPPGVVNIVHGTGSVTGAALVADPRLSRISFTGSVPTAKAIATAAAQHLTPCSLELGGKSPFIVLADADVNAAAACAALMYRNATQVCLAGTRLLVHASVRDAFVSAMRAIVLRLVVGDPRDAATEVGPIIHPRQIQRIEGYVARAVDAGATVLWGGKRHPAGAQFFEPTLLTDVAQTSEIVQEEVFGPVLTLQTFQSDAEAIALANDTVYGLGGVVYGETAHAQNVANAVRTGFVWVNSFGIRDLAAPFGGCKQSGIGREGGDWSFEFFCNVKDVVVPKQPFVPSFAQR